MLIVRWFIQNNDQNNKSYVQCINYQSSNFRWVPAFEKLRNSTYYHGVEYTNEDQIFENVMLTNEYTKQDGVQNTFTNYNFHYDVFFFFHRIKYQILYISMRTASESKYACFNDDSNHKVIVCYSIFYPQQYLI